MFVKLTRSGSRSYVKLVGAYRDDQGISRQRVVVTLCRLEQMRTGGADALIRGLHRVIGQEPQAPSVRFAGQGAACGLTDLSPEQLALFDQLQLDTPTQEPFDIAQ